MESKRSFARRSSPSCPECGFAYPGQSRRITQVEGVLTEVRAEAQRQARREQGRCQTLEDLRALAAARGYRPGWADYVWQARQQRQGGPS